MFAPHHHTTIPTLSRIRDRSFPEQSAFVAVAVAVAADNDNVPVGWDWSAHEVRTRVDVSQYLLFRHNMP
jgi:hypothetical protein